MKTKEHMQIAFKDSQCPFKVGCRRKNRTYINSHFLGFKLHVWLNSKPSEMLGKGSSLFNEPEVKALS